MSGFVNVEGLEDLQRDLDDLPRSIVRYLFPEALKAGGDVLERELAVRAPKSVILTTSAKDHGPLSGDLDTTIRVRETEGSARIGFGAKGFVARMVEFGHREVTHSGKEVGFAQARPFMRPAADTAADAAVDAFADSLANQK